MNSKCLLIILCLISFASCTKQQPHPTLVKVDSIMEASPETALQILDTLNCNPFTHLDSAYYGLLYTQALIKNNYIITDDSFMSLAREVLSSERNLKLNLRTAFYSSKVSFYSGNFIKAMRYAVEAYEIAKSQNDDYWLAKSSELLADIFGESYNYPQAEKFTRTAIVLYSKAGYPRNKDYSLCNLATYQINQGEYIEAIHLMDSLLTHVNNSSPIDTALREYASRTIIPALIYTEQYDRLTTEFSDFLKVVDDYDPIGYHVLSSYWYKQINEEELVRNNLFKALEFSNQNTDSIRAIYANYRQSLDNKNYKEAALLSDTLMYLQSQIATEQINESVTIEYADYYNRKNIEQTAANENLRFIIYTICITFSVIFILCIATIIFRGKLYKAQLEISMSEILRLTQNSSKDKILIEKLFNDRWSYFNTICSDYFDFGATEYLKAHLLQNAELELKKLQQAIKSDKFIHYIDNYLGGKLTLLKEECAFLTNSDLNTLALIATGLSMKTISLVLGIKYKTAYQKRSRLLKKIENSGASPMLFFWKKPN